MGKADSSGMDGASPAIWMAVREDLKREFGDTVFRHWLEPLSIAGRDGQTVQLALPTRFKRDWVESNYREQVRSIWRRHDATVESLQLIVAAPKAPTAGLPEESQGFVSTVSDSVPAEPATPGRASGQGTGFAATLAGTHGLDPRYTFENFVVGQPNELAYAAARRVAESRDVLFNPLFLYGGVGLGKTHLMHAIAWALSRNHPDRTVLYISAEKFMYAFVKALRFQDTLAFKEQFRSVDVLMIDDFQFIAGKEHTQEEFFHTFNALIDLNRQIIISADKSPHQLQGIEERMKSRLNWGLVADVHPTTFELRLGILQQRVDRMGVKISNDVLEFLAHRITANVRELEGALNRLVAHANLIDRPITLASTEEALADLLRASEKVVTVTDIQKAVVEHFRIKMADLSSASRARKVTRPRQIAMYLCKRLTPLSLPDIGRHFGNRDHTTVMHAVSRVETLMADDIEVRNAVELLDRVLGQG